VDIFWEIHSNLPQEGPGSDESTLKALALIPGLPAAPQILDIGCGPGRQTITLAKNISGYITALDTHEPFLEETARRAKAASVAHLITAKKQSMTQMDFAEESFDLIWAEGSIYIMGFQQGLQGWRRLLKPGGFMAVTEATWLTDTPPDKVQKFWDTVYPNMKTRQENISIIHQCRYSLIGSFTLPESAWWDGYYTPLEERIVQLCNKYHDNPEALAYLNQEQEEIDIYREFSHTYGYVFYVMQKPAEE
jgi:ubiquinone/menaquinone biosynthesis C-methylase UbiE